MFLDTAVCYLPIKIIDGVIGDKIADKIADWRDGLLNKFNSGKLPKSYELELSIRQASLRASRGLLRKIRNIQSPETLSFHRDDKIEAFIDKAEKYLVEQQVLVAKDKKWFEKLPENVPHIYSPDLINSAIIQFQIKAEDIDETSLMAAVCLDEIIKGVNADLVKESKLDCPEQVKQAFLSAEDGWPYAFRACIIEELATDNRFDKINNAYQLANIGAKFDDLRQFLLDGISPEFISSILDMQETVKNIDGKTNVILDKAKSQGEKIDSILEIVKVGQGPQDWDYFLKKHNLSLEQISSLAGKLGFSPEIEQLGVEEAKFIQSWYDLSIDSIEILRTGEEKDNDALEQSIDAFKNGRLEEADKLLEEINSTEQEYLNERQKRQSERLAFQAQIVIGLRDARRARALYDLAYSCLLPEDNGAKYNVLMSGAVLFYELGLIDRTIEALYFAKEFLEKIIEECAPSEFTHDEAMLFLLYGDVLSALGEAERGATGPALLHNSIKAYLHAQKALKYDKKNVLSPVIFTGLGNVYGKLGDRLSGHEKTAQYINAINSFENALETPRNVLPKHIWAYIKNNQGIIYHNLIKGGKPLEQARKLVKKSKDAFDDAATVSTEEKDPVSWSKIKNNLGLLLCDSARMQEKQEAMATSDQAICEFKYALRVRTRISVPQKWAMTVQNLGLAYTSKAELSEGCRQIINFKRAINAYTAALDVRTKKDFPQYWAQTQSNLGRALHGLGCVLENQDKKRNHYFDAKQAIERSLEIRTKEHLPFDWEFSQMQLVHILAELGGEFNDISYFNRAKELLKELHKYYCETGNRMMETLCMQKTDYINKIISSIAAN